MKSWEFEIVGESNDYSIFIEMIIGFCFRTGKEITCYTPATEKNTVRTLVKDWSDKGFTLSGNMYKSLLEEIRLEKNDFQ